MKKRKLSGFTLLEILLVVGAISILAGIVIFAVNPTKQLGETRNAQRRLDVNTILNAVYQYSIDNLGAMPPTVQTGTDCALAMQEICKFNSGCSNMTDLGTYLVGTSSRYVVSVPIDPSVGGGDGTGYQIYKNSSGRVTVCAPNAEQGATISVTR